MANGYIGKISAVVTANTSDLSRKLQGSVGEVDKFANRIASSIARSSAAAQDSLNKIFTPLQRLQRNIQAGLAGNVFRRDNVDQYIRGIQQAVSISEQLGKPLASGAAAFAKLSLEVQGAFLPALNRAQDAVTNLSSTLQQQGSVSARTFGQVESVVERTTQAIERLAQAQQLVSSGASSQSLAFQSPQAAAALRQSAAVRDQAAQLPPSALADGRVRTQVGNLQNVEQGILRTLARIENIKARPKVDTTELAAAEKELQRLAAASERIRASIGSVVNADKVAAAAKKAADDEIAALIRREQAAKRLDEQLAASAMKRADDEIESLVRREQAAKRLDQQLAESAKKAADDEIAALIRREQAAKRLAEQLAAADPRERVRQRDQEEEAQRLRRDEELRAIAGRRTDLGGRLAEQGQRRVQGLTGNVNIDSRDRLGGQAQRDIDALATRVGAVRQQLEALPNSIRTRFVPELQRAQQELIRLQNAPAATADQIDAAAAAVKRLEQNAARAKTALDLPSAAEGLEAGATRAFSGQLEAAQRILVQVGETAGGPVTRAYERLRAAQQRFIAEGIAGTPRATRAIDALQKSLARVAADTGKISFSRALREVQRGGDIARGSFGNTQLAIQQATFAVDDFFSVTGGLDQRIRAVGNNLTQLGFILGGTTGLFVGLGAVIGAQAILFINKFIFRSEEAKSAASALNNALDSQKSKVQELASAYSQLADEIAKSVSAPNRQTEFDQRRGAEQRRRDREAAALEAFAATSPSLAGVRGREADAKKRREEATTVGAQLRAADEERRAAFERGQRERVALGQARREADRLLSQQAAGGESARFAAEREIRSLQQRINRLESTGLASDSDVAPFRERQAVLRGAQVLIQQQQAESFLQRGQAFANRAAGGLSSVTGFSEVQSRLDALFTDFQRTQQGILDGSLSPDDIENAVAQFDQVAAALELAVISVGGFAAALDSAAKQLSDTVVSELRGQEDQARRQANAAEAQFGAGSSQASIARRDQGLIEAERRRAQDRAQSIDEQISIRRRRFEQDLLAGRGGARDVERAREISRLRQIEDDQSQAASAREDARLRRQALEAEQARSFENNPDVRDLRRQADLSDIEAQRRLQEIESAARGRALAQSQLENRRSEIQAAARDIGAAQRLGDIGPAQVQQAAANLANSIAPAFASLRDELLTARLQGPSRAGLTVSDINTAEGSRELNRLIRGDDSARDVNLQELQTQSRLLEEIKNAIQAETAVVVDL